MKFNLITSFQPIQTDTFFIKKHFLGGIQCVYFLVYVSLLSSEPGCLFPKLKSAGVVSPPPDTTTIKGIHAHGCFWAYNVNCRYISAVPSWTQSICIQCCTPVLYPCASLTNSAPEVFTPLTNQDIFCDTALHFFN